MGFLKELERKIRHTLRPKKDKRHALVGQAKLWQMKREFQIGFVKARGLVPSHYFLDIGCGTLRGGLPVIDYLEAGRYYGIDVRPEVLDEARKELHEAGLDAKSPTLRPSPDMAALDLGRQFDFVWAFSVLIHMSDPILAPTLGFVARHLAPGGVFFANVNIGDARQGDWQGFPVVWRTMEFYREQCARHGLVIADVGSLAEVGHVSGVESQDVQRMLRITRS